VIGVDTNVLLRFLTADDPVQSPAAKAFLEERTGEDPAYVSLVCLLETVWTLRAGYGQDKEAVNSIVATLAAQDNIVLQDADAVREALGVARATSADFPDALLVALGRKAACRHCVTFDRRAGRIPGMTVL
jgi:predicted nucleic-acid-binding protein